MVSADLPHASASAAPVAWDEQLLRNPHAVADKQRRVQKMFAAIAPSYDLNNRLHSLWMDQLWRRKAVKLSELKARDRVVDVACGTGDLALKYSEALAFHRDRLSERGPDLEAHQVIGIDYTWEMLPIARSKANFQMSNTGEVANGRSVATVTWLNGDAQRLPLPDACADVVSIAFGIRNVADPGRAIREFYRVLRPGGRLIILEFSLPTNSMLRGFYNLYFRKVLPRTATWISGDKTGAYKYLPESVNTFIGREQMTGMMQAAGFADVTQHPMTFGVCVCYRGFRK